MEEPSASKGPVVCTNCGAVAGRIPTDWSLKGAASKKKICS